MPTPRLSRVIAVALSLLVATSAHAQDGAHPHAVGPVYLRRRIERLDSLTRLVRTVVAQPRRLEMRVDDSIQVQTLYALVHWTGLGRKRDTIPEFRRTTMVVPGPSLVQRGDYYVAERPGRATLVIYVRGSDRIMKESTVQARFPITIR